MGEDVSTRDRGSYTEMPVLELKLRSYPYAEISGRTDFAL